MGHMAYFLFHMCQVAYSYFIHYLASPTAAYNEVDPASSLECRACGRPSSSHRDFLNKNIYRPTTRRCGSISLQSAIKGKGGSFTVPESEETGEEATKTTEGAPPKETTAHTEIQWLLLKLGSDMGLDVWVARNDRGKEANGHRFVDLPRLIDSLPLQFDEATNRTVELIDVLWLKGNAIVAAFEIESTTSSTRGYSECQI